MSRLGNNKDLLDQVVELFENEAERFLDSLQEALEGESGEEVRGRAHTFKGSVSTLGAQALVATLQEIERRGHQGRVLQARALLPRVVKQLNNLRTALRELQQGES